MTYAIQVIGVAMIVAGAVLTFVTAIGMVRLTTLYSRMHAATKPQVLGLILLCAGLALVMHNPRIATTLVLVIVLQLIVAPISAHMLGRGAYRNGLVSRDEMLVDEYAEDIRRAKEQIADSRN